MRIALVILAGLVTLQTPNTQILLIVKGDDMGAGHGINVATIDVGVHLAITSEWENVKWRPLMSVPSIVDADGYFFPTVIPRPGFPPNMSIKESSWKIDEIERELRAQLTTAKRHLPQATYTWPHMLFTSLSPDVGALVGRLSKEYGLVVPFDLEIQWLRGVYDGKDSGAVKAAKLAAQLETLGPGVWEHIDHAATDDPEMRAYGHQGYEWVAADRSAVLEAWTSPKVRDVITRRGIKLTNYRDLTTP